MQAQVLRRVAQADEAIAALRKQILTLQAPSVKDLRRENETLRARVARAKMELEKAEAEAMPNTRELLDKNWAVKSSMFKSDYGGRSPAVATVDGAVHGKAPAQQGTGSAAVLSSSNETKTTTKKDKPKKEKKEKAPKKKAAAPEEPAAEPLSRLDLRVGKIVEVSKHPEAEKLYVEKVDVGEAEPRQILSGLVEHVPLSEMQDRLAIFLLNLKPAKMRGIESQGMIMCASSAEKVEIIEVPTGAVPGDLVTFEGYPRTPDARLNPKKKIWEQVAPDLAVDAEGVARYKSVAVQIQGREGKCVAPTLKNVPIK